MMALSQSLPLPEDMQEYVHCQVEWPSSHSLCNRGFAFLPQSLTHFEISYPQLAAIPDVSSDFSADIMDAGLKYVSFAICSCIVKTPVP